MIKSALERDSMISALNMAGYSELPDLLDEKSNEIWVTAILKVMKSDGTHNYCIADNREAGNPWIVKDFGNSSMITKIEEIRPFSYLNKKNMPNLRSHEDCIIYLTKYGYDETAIRYLLSDVRRDGTGKTDDEIKADKNKVKKLIIKCAIKTSLQLRDFSRVVERSFMHGKDKESGDTGED